MIIIPGNQKINSYKTKKILHGVYMPFPLNLQLFDRINKNIQKSVNFL